jgi:hypothetical protein
LRIERTRADGRVIEARRNPVPGGGTITVDSEVGDFTEFTVRLPRKMR